MTYAMHDFRTLMGLALAWAALWPVAVASAQEPAPPAAVRAAPAPAQPVLPALETIREPAALAVIESNPQTPAELVRAAKTLAELDQKLWAREFLRRLMTAKPDQAALAALVEQLGSAIFVELAADAEMNPEGPAVSRAVFAAARAELQRPERLQSLVKQVSDPAPQLRLEAVARLRQVGAAAVPLLVEGLRDPARAGEHPYLRSALARMGSVAVGPLTASLDSGEPALAAQAAEILAAMEARDALPFLIALSASPDTAPPLKAAADAALQRLLGVTPRDPAEAARLLAEQARRYYNQRQPLPEEGGRTTVWLWDRATSQPVPRVYLAEDAARVMARRWARLAYALRPGDAELEKLYLATMLEAAAYINGLDNPLPTEPGTAAALASRHGQVVLEDVLAQALREKRSAVAAATARLLGQIGTAEELLHGGASPEPLVAAVTHADRRVRMAALEAILALKPKARFAGSSHVPLALEFFASTSGTRRAVVACPLTDTARALATMLARLGYETDTARSGEDMLELVLASPDYELALIDPAIDRPPVDMLIQQLRQHSRTADLRIGLIARAGMAQRAEQVARRYAGVMAFDRPGNERALRWQVGELLATDPREFVPFAQRQQQAAQALAWLVELTDRPDDLAALGPLEDFNLRKMEEAVTRPLYVPELRDEVIAILGNLGTHAAQLTLVNVASRPTQPLAARRLALTAFGRNVEQSGILLTRVEILRQYERYNQSAPLDAATQAVLAQILDYIEAPSLALASPPLESKAKPE